LHYELCQKLQVDGGRALVVAGMRRPLRDGLLLLLMQQHMEPHMEQPCTTLLAAAVGTQVEVVLVLVLVETACMMLLEPVADARVRDRAGTTLQQRLVDITTRQCTILREVRVYMMRQVQEQECQRMIVVGYVDWQSIEDRASTGSLQAARYSMLKGLTDFCTR
jgi:hypothetical protein